MLYLCVFWCILVSSGNQCEGGMNWGEHWGQSETDFASSSDLARKVWPQLASLSRYSTWWRSEVGWLWLLSRCSQMWSTKSVYPPCWGQMQDIMAWQQFARRRKGWFAFLIGLWICWLHDTSRLQRYCRSWQRATTDALCLGNSKSQILVCRGMLCYAVVLGQGMQWN